MSEPVVPAPSPQAAPQATPPQSGAATLPKVLVGACMAVIATVGLVAIKSGKHATALESDLSSARASNSALTRERDEAKAKLLALTDEKQKLSGELQETAAEKQAAQAELERTRAELASKLASEIKQGEVVLRLRGGDLVVDVADKVLFDTGKADVSARGQAVLKQVASSIVRMPKHVFQVSGHTDAARVKSADVREHYPTNWELSTARATNVVRFLQEKCGIPGRRLVAAGYAEHQPVASNATEKGKQRNRRIEIALIKEVPAE